MRGAAILAERLTAPDATAAGIDVLTGGTDVHLVLVDLRNSRADGQGGGGPAARGRHHGQQERRAERPASADGDVGRADRHAGARDPRFRRRRVHRGGGHHRPHPHARTPTSPALRARVTALAEEVPALQGPDRPGRGNDGVSPRRHRDRVRDQGGAEVRVAALRERGASCRPRHPARRGGPRFAELRRRQAPRLGRGRHRVDPRRPAGHAHPRRRCAPRSPDSTPTPR